MGWDLCKKDYQENNIFDLGIRGHVVVFLLLNGMVHLNGVINYCISDNPYIVYGSSKLRLSEIWSVLLLIHFIIFCFTKTRLMKQINKQFILCNKKKIFE